MTQLLNGCIIVDAGDSLANTSRWEDYRGKSSAARGVSLVDNLQPVSTIRVLQLHRIPAAVILRNVTGYDGMH